MVAYKRQHTVPKSYLRGFTRTCNGGELVQYDKQSAKILSVPPDDASIWKFEYSFTREDGTRNHNGEKNLSIIESDAIPIIRDMQQGIELSLAQRMKVSMFVISAIRRPRYMMEAFTNAGLAQSQDSRWTQQIVEKIEKDARRRLSDEERIQYLGILKELQRKRNPDEVKARQLGVWFEGLPGFAAQFINFNWNILVARPPSFFVTSDSPAFTRRVGDAEKDFDEFIRLVDPEVEVVLPLSQSHLLLARRSSWTEGKRPSKTRVRELNNRIIRMAKRYIWSPTEFLGIQHAVEHFSECQPPEPPFISLYDETIVEKCS